MSECTGCHKVNYCSPFCQRKVTSAAVLLLKLVSFFFFFLIEVSLDLFILFAGLEGTSAYLLSGVRGSGCSRGRANHSHGHGQSKIKLQLSELKLELRKKNRKKTNIQTSLSICMYV